MKQNYTSYKNENRPKVVTSGIESSGLSPNLFLSGKLKTYNMSSRPLPEFPCGHSCNTAIIHYSQ